MYRMQMTLNPGAPFPGYRMIEALEREAIGCVTRTLRATGTSCDIISRCISERVQDRDGGAVVRYAELEVELVMPRNRARRGSMVHEEWIRFNNTLNQEIDRADAKLHWLLVTSNPPDCEARTMYIRCKGVGRRSWPFKVQDGRKLWLSGDPDTHPEVWVGDYQEEVLP